MKKAILVFALLTGCADPSREPIPDCVGGEKDQRCVICVDREGNGDWYFLGSVNGQQWSGCPEGTTMFKPYKKGE